MRHISGISYWGTSISGGGNDLLRVYFKIADRNNCLVWLLFWDPDRDRGPDPRRYFRSRIDVAFEHGSAVSRLDGDGLQLRLADQSELWQRVALESADASTHSPIQLLVPKRRLPGATGVDPERGLTVIQQEEAAVFRAMARQARQRIVVADSSKLGLVSPAVVCAPKEIDLLITDHGISDEIAHQFAAIGMKVLVV
jgi:hypothetical protein